MSRYKDAATWKRKTGNDGDDDIYSSTSIMVHWVQKSRVVRTVGGDEIQCQAIVNTKSDVQPDDVLTHGGRDWPVLGVVGVVKGPGGKFKFKTIAMGAAGAQR